GSLMLYDFREGRIEVALAAGIYDINQLSCSAGCLLNLSQYRFVVGVGRIYEHGDRAPRREQLAQKLQPLRSHHGGEVDRAGRISTGASEAGDETIFHRIATARKDDRNGRSCRLGYDRRMQAACRNDNRHLTTDEVGDQ